MHKKLFAFPLLYSQIYFHYLFFLGHNSGILCTLVYIFPVFIKVLEIELHTQLESTTLVYLERDAIELQSIASLKKEKNDDL